MSERIDHSTEPCAGYLFPNYRFGSQDERVQVIRQCLDQPTLMIARPDLRAKALQALSEIAGSR
jgi:hypothetical protein